MYLMHELRKSHETTTELWRNFHSVLRRIEFVKLFLRDADCAHYHILSVNSATMFANSPTVFDFTPLSIHFWSNGAFVRRWQAERTPKANRLVLIVHCQESRSFKAGQSSSIGVKDQGLQYSESLLMQLLPVERVMASETIRNIAETDSKMACNSHGSAAPYDLDLLECRSLS